MPYTTVWYCCNCSYGPCNLELDIACPMCGTRRCDGCKIEVMNSVYSTFPPAQGPIRPSMELSQTCNTFLPTCNSIHHSEGLSIPTFSAVGRLPFIAESGTASAYNIFGHSGLLRQLPNNYYYCCQCNDGPKMYDNQPQCVNCCHTICFNCRAA
ncbi:hypothetical protein BGW36DRAFT_371678 [Talaromyces proteolyticus]|uniref:Uncharacterized protein n=1 Tax=Talaromyces proteolyticus TaxID=1131652 RepID=A0AAD4KV88_9EURO|nr:uncharacterized protein BGW36DRAFT_371678 [Talaromyces proteolyticus]KAH8701847.1 hypothetical protein BGW36DRAFT_371678 [Talaromyces proteolyticus]